MTCFSSAELREVPNPGDQTDRAQIDPGGVASPVLFL